MSRKNFNLSLPEWMLNDIIGESENRSARIQELLMKGHLYEKEQQSNQTFKKEIQSQSNTQSGILREYVNPVRSPLFLDRCNQDAI